MSSRDEDLSPRRRTLMWISGCALIVFGCIQVVLQLLPDRDSSGIMIGLAVLQVLCGAIIAGDVIRTRRQRE